MTASASAFRRLAHAAGLDTGYESWRGEQIASSDEAVLAMLRALGHAIADPAAAPAALAALERAQWSEIVPAVVIGWDGALVVPFRVPAEADGAWELEIETEAGRRITAHGRLFELPADSHAWPEGVVHCVRRATVSLDGETGYHRVAWRALGTHGEALGISAPQRAWGAPGTEPRRWGVFAPVYALSHGGPAGGIGTLANLRDLFDQVDRLGGSYIATLPLLAAFLDEPCAFSPYAPASRLFWNELYLDQGRLADDTGVRRPPLRPRAPSPSPHIDYRSEYILARDPFDQIARELLATPARRAEIEAWASASETCVFDYAAFRALGEVARAPWQTWPAAVRDPAGPPVTDRAGALALGADPARLDHHVVAQWAMQRQLSALGARSGARLYLDLPVGVSCDAYEVWRDRHLFLTALSAGAPPDALFLGGQSWGLPPLSPAALRRDRYRYVRACLRHHMAVAGMLRIDHVMGLFRLYCVPSGFPATDGVYLRYPAEELLAVLTLESQRARCAVVGEDLGTVPVEVRPLMAKHGLFRLHVGQFGMPVRAGERPVPAPPDSIASLNTHDTATFAGWWRGADIDDRRSLDLITDAQEAAERAEREQQRAALLALPEAPAAGADVERALVAVTTDLATGPAEVVLVSLDDLVLEPVPHNVPGTTSERPNWQRRIARFRTALDDGAAVLAPVRQRRR